MKSPKGNKSMEGWNIQRTQSQTHIFSKTTMYPMYWIHFGYIYTAIIKSNLRAIKNCTLSYPTAQCIHCAVICNNSNLAVIDIVVSLYLEYFLNSFNGHTRCLRFLYHGLTFVWLRLASQNQSDNARLLWIKSNFHQINVSLSFLLSLPSGC